MRSFLTKHLKELVANTLLQKWVDKGRVLNKNKKLVLFVEELLHLIVGSY